MRILDTRQMREADRRTTEDIGIASIVLMENAGRQVVGAMEAIFEDLDTHRIAVLCGTGNNGGDGFVIARTLAERGIDLAVYLVGAASAVAGDARANLTVLMNLGIDLVEVPDEEFDSMGANVLAIAPRSCVMVEGNPVTRDRLEDAGARVAEYRGREISLKGGGGPTCLTRPMARA